MKKATEILLGLTAGLLIAGCNTGGCYDNQSAIPLATFYSSETGKKVSLSILEISGVDAPNDSLLTTEGSPISEVYLPMRSTKTSTSWCLHYTQDNISDPSFNDTVSFFYSSEPYFASSECGAMYNYRILRVENTFHLLDSVVVTDSLITNIDISTINFYFRTAPAEEPEPSPEPEPTPEPEPDENEE